MSRSVPYHVAIALSLVMSFACADESSTTSSDTNVVEIPEIVVNRSTGLEWPGQDNDAEVNWQEAERFCRDTSRMGKTDWRLPTIDELAGLYDPAAEASCGDSICRLAEPIRLTSAYLWSASPENSDRRFYFDFRFGTRLAPLFRPDLTRWVLCVRSIRGG